MKIIYYKVIFKVGAPLHVPSLAALHCIILQVFCAKKQIKGCAWFAVWKPKETKTADVKPKYNHRLSLKPNILLKVLFLLFRSTAGCGNNHKTHKKTSQNTPEHQTKPDKSRNRNTKQQIHWFDILTRHYSPLLLGTFFEEVAALMDLVNVKRIILQRCRMDSLQIAIGLKNKLHFPQKSRSCGGKHIIWYMNIIYISTIISTHSMIAHIFQY